MTDYAALKAKIDADHVSQADEEIIESLVAKNLLGKKPIDSEDIIDYLFLHFLHTPIKRSTSEAAETARDGLERYKQFDIRVPEKEAALIRVLDDLVAEAGLPNFTAEHKTGILQLGNVMESWADQNIGCDVTVKDIRMARDL